MDMEFKWDTREFERAMEELSNESDLADYDIITSNARTLLRAVKFNTPRDTGSTRAGWWPAWEKLDMAGTPGTRRAFREWKRGKRRYIPDGKVIDKRNDKGEQSFEFINKTHLINEKGQKIYYPYVLNTRRNFMGRSEEEATFKFGRTYERLLKRHGKL